MREIAKGTVVSLCTLVNRGFANVNFFASLKEKTLQTAKYYFSKPKTTTIFLKQFELKSD